MTDREALPLDGWMVAWTPIIWRRLGRAAPPGAIEVGPWPDETGWSDKFAMTCGCCEVARHHSHKAQKIALMFIISTPASCATASTRTPRIESS